jgi:enoyl-CoA hydratase/carnithine racemase
MNRPERMNALTAALLDSLAEALDELSSDGAVRCVVLRGAGEKAFSCGMDLTRMAKATPEENNRLIGAGGPLRRALDAVERHPFPVVAVIRGYAAGAALELALACDIRVASEGSRFGMPPARLGIVYPPDGLERFVRIVGLGTARKMFYTASYFDSVEALRMGVVDFLAPAAELDDFAGDLAGRLSGNAPLSMKGHKRSFRLIREGGTPSEGAREELRRLGEEALNSRDAVEGMAAFNEKRDPRFTGE